MLSAHFLSTASKVILAALRSSAARAAPASRLIGHVRIVGLDLVMVAI